MTSSRDHEHLDHMLDAVRVVEAVLNGDDASFNAVLQTTTCSPTKMVLARATILACAAADHPDPDQAIRELRTSLIGAAP